MAVLDEGLPPSLSVLANPSDSVLGRLMFVTHPESSTCLEIRIALPHAPCGVYSEQSDSCPVVFHSGRVWAASWAFNLNDS